MKQRCALLFLLAAMLSHHALACDGKSDSTQVGAGEEEVTLTTTCEPAPLSVSDPWIRLAPPTAEVLAAYAELKNDSDQELIIEQLFSAQFDKVELHEMSMTDGIMKMRRADPYTMKGKETLKLEPGGWHLMLIGPKQAMPVGAKAKVTIRTNVGDLDLDLQVYPPKS